MHNDLVFLSDSEWCDDGEFWFRGWFELDGRKFSGESALRELHRIGIAGAAAHLRGSFGVIHVNSTGITLFSDRLRSFPLLYKRGENGWVVGDSIFRMRDSSRPRLEAFREFLATGYVTGPDTLWEGVQQVQAGEYVTITGEKVVRMKYYYHVHRPVVMSTLSRSELLQEVLDQVFADVVSRLGGRPAAVMLSGGYDSRLVLQQLLRQGYDNIVAVSFGRDRNPEVLAACDVATKLGVSWHRFQPGRNFYRRTIAKPEFQEFIEASGRGVSTVYAMGLLMGAARDIGLIPSDSVVLTGNSGDLLEGDQIDPIFASRDSFKAEDIVHSILTKHYMLMGDRFAFRPEFHDRVRASLELQDQMYSPEEAADLSERFNWRERQAKYVIQDARSYEHLGLDYFFPLWDYRFMDFWLTVPLSDRFERTFYYQFVDGENYRTANAPTGKQQITRVLKRHGSRVLRFAYPFEKMRQYLVGDDPYNALGLRDQMSLLRLTKGYRTSTVSGHLFHQIKYVYSDLFDDLLADIRS